jgi:protein subunit release factor A
MYNELDQRKNKKKDMPKTDIKSEQGDILTETALMKLRDELKPVLKEKDQFDNHDANISISGRQGSEDIVEALKKTYQKFCEKYNLSCQTIDDEGTNVLLRIADPCNASIDWSYPYGLFKFETGIHSFIKMNENNRKKKLTQPINVQVYPEVTENEVVFEDKDINIETFSGSSVGGQHANKSETNVRVTHIPTGIQCVSRGRSRFANLKSAKATLFGKVIAYNNSKSEVFVPRQGQGSSESRYRRKYQLTGNRYIVDNLGTKTSNVEGFFNGNILEFLKSR